MNIINTNTLICKVKIKHINANAYTHINISKEVKEALYICKNNVVKEKKIEDYII